MTYGRGVVRVTLVLSVLAWAGFVAADDLVVSGSSMVIDTDTQVDGSVFVQDGGTLTIKTFEKSDKILAEINDTGMGIDEEDMKKIFEACSTD